MSALHRLSAEARLDQAARSACLYYALRHFYPAGTIDAVVETVDQRLQAFQRLIAEVPDLLDYEPVDVTLEDAVYATIAQTPLIVIDGRARFDLRAFAARLPSALSREVNARAGTGRRRSAERAQLFLETLH